jgi:hypothetical protein
LRRAKYIEGLENRLARMESLMRLSGVLPEDDDGSTDLATLEKRLADRAGSRTGGDSATPVDRASEERRSSVHMTQKNTATPVQPGLPSPRSGTTSPEPQRQTTADKEEDTLAEMMCSLVTNNYGETRYIGKLLQRYVGVSETHIELQDLPPDSPSSRPKVFNGSMTKLGMPHSKT